MSRRNAWWLVVALVAVLAVAPPTAAAADVVFAEPAASGAFGEPVRFTTTFQSDSRPVRVELLTTAPGGEGRRVSIASVDGGPDVWRASVVQAGHVVPNTVYDYRFRVITEDGAEVGPQATHRIIDERLEWQTIEGDRVNVWWHEGDRSFAERALRIAEEAMESSAELLGVEDIEPVDFIIYSDSRAFRQAMGPATRENVGGQAHPDIDTLFGLIEPRQINSDWVEEVVVHELSHLVFDAAVSNPFAYPPRWLNEGLAVYVSGGYSAGDRGQVERAAGAGNIIPLDGLGGQFPTRPTRFSLAYAESVSAVDFFVEEHGEDRLVELITSFADGIGLDAAFVAATGADFGAFDDAWMASLGAERPDALGPRPAPPGNTPADWDSPPDALLR